MKQWKRLMPLGTPVFFVLVFFILSGSASLSQGGDDPAKAEALLRDAIKVRGGDAYLKARTAISRGQYTAYEKGVSGNPQEFVDYIVYPDSERTEFGKGDHKFIQTNSGNSGWVYDGSQKMVREQTPEQVQNFKQEIRRDLDYLLRSGWQEPGVKLAYLGRREIWRNTFSEVVRLTYADGYNVTLHFDPRAKFPMMVEYEASYKNQDDEVKTGQNQVRYFRWIDYGGVQFPTVQDRFRDGVQSARANFDTVSFNTPVSDKLFAKPNNSKDVK